MRWTAWRPERSIQELYADDPERADAIAFGRRGALHGPAAATLGAAVRGRVPFAAAMPAGLLPAALARPIAGPGLLEMPGKAPLVVLGGRPLVAETPEHLLDDEVTPTERVFIRNNGLLPEPPAGDGKAWTLRVDGEVNTPLQLTVGELESRFPLVTLALQMECGGNGRAYFMPETRGNQWTNGAISNARWTGVRLRDVLQAAGLKPSAVHTGHYGADPHLSGATDRPSISRGVPIAKAMEEHTLIATRMNGQTIPLIHGAPLRLIVPGWPGSVSAKWLTRIWVRDCEHDGPGMGGTAYRVPVRSIIPGSHDSGVSFRNLESMPVRSILTNVRHGTRLPAGTRALDIRGFAWAGEKQVRAVDASADFGATWSSMEVKAPANKYAWQRWSGRVALPGPGYYEVWYRATDSDGAMQTLGAGNWNPQGYGGNPITRIAVLVEG